MSGTEEVTTFWQREMAREQAFTNILVNEINHVFADVAHYYDRVNQIASLGQGKSILIFLIHQTRAFLSKLNDPRHSRGVYLFNTGARIAALTIVILFSSSRRLLPDQG